MSRSQHVVSTLARGHFTVYNSSDAVVTGLADGDFTKRLAKNDANDTTTVTIAEIANGRYQASFTPGSTGAWYLLVTHATHNVRGWQESWDVIAAAVPTAAENATAVHATTKDGLTLLEHSAIQSAALAGKSSGFASGAGTRTLRAVNDSKDRITATQDANANRTAVTVDAT